MMNYLFLFGACSAQWRENADYGRCDSAVQYVLMLPAECGAAKASCVCMYVCMYVGRSGNANGKMVHRAIGPGLSGAW